MAFEIVKKFVVKAEPKAVWAFLIDPERVASCLPGAAITGKLDDKTWQGTMTVKVGPVQSSYKGKVVFEKLDAAARTAEIVQLRHAAKAHVEEPAYEIDPICNMKVDAKTARFTADRGGRKYYFCNPKCRAKFLAA